MKDEDANRRSAPPRKELDEAAVKGLFEDLMRSVEAHYFAQPTDRAAVFEALQSLPMAAGSVLSATGADLIERMRQVGHEMIVFDQTLAGTMNGIFGAERRGVYFWMMASAADGWEHVSVSVRPRARAKSVRAPTWEEMCWVKSLFWRDEEPVMQLHPAASENVSFHDFCLHLWRPTEQAIPLPPAILVGVKLPAEQRDQVVAALKGNAALVRRAVETSHRHRDAPDVAQRVAAAVLDTKEHSQ